MKKLNKTNHTRNELYNKIKDDIKGSCLWEVMEGRSLSCESSKNVPEIECPTLLDLAKNYHKERKNSDTDGFSQYVVFTKEQIECVKQKTVEQSQSEH